jgi:hypothetical protein
VGRHLEISYLISFSKNQWFASLSQALCQNLEILIAVIFDLGVFLQAAEPFIVGIVLPLLH